MSFYADTITKSLSFRSTERVSDTGLLEPVTRAAVQSIISKAAAKGVQFVIFETYRSEERQRQLYLQGKSRLEAVGVHHYGLACDLVRMVDGKLNWDVDYSLLQPLSREDELIWGGDWGNPDVPHNFVDRDHVQRCALSDQTALFARRWYPDVSYDPYHQAAEITLATPSGGQTA